MKIIEVWNKSVGFINEIKAKHMRKIYPLMQKIEWNEIDITIEVSKILFIDLDGEKDVKKYEEFVDELSIPDMTKLLEEVWSIIADGSKKK